MGQAKVGTYRHADPWHSKLIPGMWNVTSLVGKEPELVQEVEWY